MGELVNLAAYRQAKQEAEEEAQAEVEATEIREVQEMLDTLRQLSAQLPPIEPTPYVMTLEEMMSKINPEENFTWWDPAAATGSYYEEDPQT